MNNLLKVCNLNGDLNLKKKCNQGDKYNKMLKNDVFSNSN